MDNNQENKSDQVEAEEGNIIDVEPEVEAPPSSQSSEKAATQQNKLPLPLILAIVAIIAITITWFAAYRYWQNLLNDLTNMQQRISTTHEQQQVLNSEIETAKQALQEQKQKLLTQAEQVETQTQQMGLDKDRILRQTEVMQKAVDQVNEKIGSSSNEWLLAEAEYLMRIANHRLTFNQDSNTAAAALQQADEKLRDSGDLGLIGVRDKLAAEINQLKAFEPVDIAGMAASLQSLSQQVEQLKLKGITLTHGETGETAADEPMGRNLDSLLSDSWRGFRELMVIRKHDQPVSAMLPPSQQYFLYQNLRLQLESARLALLRQENILFKSSLDTAIEWLNSFFDGEDNATSQMLATLTQLKNTELDPALPNISASLNLLTQYRENAE